MLLKGLGFNTCRGNICSLHGTCLRGGYYVILLEHDTRIETSLPRYQCSRLDLPWMSGGAAESSHRYIQLAKLIHQILCIQIMIGCDRSD